VTDTDELEIRARLSRGTSDAAIYGMVRGALLACGAGGILVDVGCGTGQLWSQLRGISSRYVGVDAVRYEGFPAEQEFVSCDLETGRVPLSEASADVVTAVEVIEHVENPRALMRELVRLVRPGGWVVLTTPNQLSALSLATLVVKHQFSQFQDGDYPAHRSALLEVDLHRIAQECGLVELRCAFSLQGRVPLTATHWPRVLARLFPRALSDNILLIGRKPAASAGT
jgi:2-polyprenyl-3-methyl-5-hydroxy-6-metoxy-1,4-benzoquinol methylase